MASQQPRAAAPRAALPGRRRPALAAAGAALLRAALVAPSVWAAAAAAEDAPGPGHYAWPQKGGGRSGASGSGLYAGPRSIGNETLKWTWSNPDDELVRFGPLIDDKDNIYLLTVSGFVRKFDAQGRLWWSFRTASYEGKIVTPGVLYQGSLYFISYGSGGDNSLGHLFSVNMETGDINYRVHLPRGTSFATVTTEAEVAASEHSGGLAVHNGTLFTAVREQGSTVKVSNKILALSAHDGRLLWDFVLKLPAAVVNFQPSFPGDGTMLFSTPSARAYRLSLDDGTVVWEPQYPEVWYQVDGAHESLQTGGGVLSPSGSTFIALGNYYHWEVDDTGSLGHDSGPAEPFPGAFPCNVQVRDAALLGETCAHGVAVIIAYDVEDGVILWHRRFFLGVEGISYPAVGQVFGLSEPALVLPLGRNPERPYVERGPEGLPSFVRSWLARHQPHSEWLRSFLHKRPLPYNSIVVLNLTNGHEIWRFTEGLIERLGAAGDEEGIFRRMDARLGGDQRRELFCQPESWAPPIIGADGTVYAASGWTGRVYAMRDEDGNGRISKSEFSFFETGQGFSHSPAIGRRILAAAPCWGPMYVFG